MPLPSALLAAWRSGYASAQPVVSRTTARLPIAALDVVLLLVIGGVAVAVLRKPGGARVRRAVLLLVLAVAGGWVAWPSSR